MHHPNRHGRGRSLLIAFLAGSTLLVAACGTVTPAPASPSAALPSAATPSSSASPAAASPAAAASAPGASAAPSAGATAGATDLAAATAPPVDCATLVATPAQTEGPYFTAGSPEKTDLREEGMTGTTLVVVGHVVDASCRPIAGALIDVWQADADGVYDNAGFRLRGHLFSAADGSYRFVTIVPGLYPGRTEHIHVKVTPPDDATLTTQLYFPDVTQNDADGIFDPAGLLAITEIPGGLLGVYTFVL